MKRKEITKEIFDSIMYNVCVFYSNDKMEKPKTYSDYVKSVYNGFSYLLGKPDMYNTIDKINIEKNKNFKSFIDYNTINNIKKMIGTDTFIGKKYIDVDLFDKESQCTDEEFINYDFSEDEPIFALDIFKFLFGGNKSNSAITIDNIGENNIMFIRENLSNNKRKKLNKVLNNYIKDLKYKIIERDDKLFDIYTESEDGSSLLKNIIDPFGFINGGTKPSIMIAANVPNINDIIWTFIPFEDNKDLIHKMLTDKSFCCNINDINNIKTKRLGYPLTYIDMSNTKWMDDITKEDLAELDSNLTSVFNFLNASNVTPARYRFESFKDKNNFTLVSDYKCKTPLKDEKYECESLLNKNKEKIIGNDLQSNINNEFRIIFDNKQLYTEKDKDPNTKVLMYDFNQQPVNNNWTWWNNMSPSIVM